MKAGGESLSMEPAWEARVPAEDGRWFWRDSVRESLYVPAGRDCGEQVIWSQSKKLTRGCKGALVKGSPA